VGRIRAAVIEHDALIAFHDILFYTFQTGKDLLRLVMREHGDHSRLFGLLHPCPFASYLFKNILTSCHQMSGRTTRRCKIVDIYTFNLKAAAIMCRV
jgi:hypothetical protein